MVLKIGPDRLARPIQLGTEHQSGPIKLIIKAKQFPKTNQLKYIEE